MIDMMAQLWQLCIIATCLSYKNVAIMYRLIHVVESSADSLDVCSLFMTRCYHCAYINYQTIIVCILNEPFYHLDVLIMRCDKYDIAVYSYDIYFYLSVGFFQTREVYVIFFRNYLSD